MLAVRLEMAAVYLRLVRGLASASITRSGADLCVGIATAIAEFTGGQRPHPSRGGAVVRGAPGDPASLETESGEALAARRAARRSRGAARRRGRARGSATAAVPGQGARGRRAAVAAGPSQCASRRSRDIGREERLGVPLSSPARNYRDRSHKPELLVALEPFEALAGFRPAARTIELMRALAVSDLDPFVDLLNGQSDADGLRALFTTWITAPQPDLDVLVPAVLDGAINYLRSGATEFADEAKDGARAGRAVSRRRGSAGGAAAQPDGARTRARRSSCLPATCTPTCAVSAVEVMANSDNVLRGGLTPKHVDVPELLRVLDFTRRPRRHFGRTCIGTDRN